MARKPTGNPTGRPQKIIDWGLFEKLCPLQCTQGEIAGILEVHPETLSNRVKEHYGENYSSVYEKFGANGKISLRRNQFVLSKTNANMAIWLGKIWLGQRDTSRDEIREVAEDAIRRAVREIDANSRAENARRRELENEQSLLHQGPGREEDPLSSELGTTGTEC